MEIVALFLLAIVAMVIYCLPTIIAAIRGHHQFVAITIFNILGGWIGIGWLIALIWACSPATPRELHQK